LTAFLLPLFYPINKFNPTPYKSKTLDKFSSKIEETIIYDSKVYEKPYKFLLKY